MQNLGRGPGKPQTTQKLGHMTESGGWVLKPLCLLQVSISSKDDSFNVVWVAMGRSLGVIPRWKFTMTLGHNLRRTWKYPWHSFSVGFQNQDGHKLVWWISVFIQKQLRNECQHLSYLRPKVNYQNERKLSKSQGWRPHSLRWAQTPNLRGSWTWDFRLS